MYIKPFSRIHIMFVICEFLPLKCAKVLNFIFIQTILLNKTRWFHEDFLIYK